MSLMTWRCAPTNHAVVAQELLAAPPLLVLLPDLVVDLVVILTNLIQMMWHVSKTVLIAQYWSVLRSCGAWSAFRSRVCRTSWWRPWTLATEGRRGDLCQWTPGWSRLLDSRSPTACKHLQGLQGTLVVFTSNRTARNAHSW